MVTETSVQYGAAPLRLGVSREFATFAAALRFDDLPPQVVHESRRGVMDWLGCALAGSRHPTVAKLQAGLTAMGSLERVPVIGSDRRVGLMEGALVNGQMGHVLDFDDTHMEGVVLHNSSPVCAALLAAVETGTFSGRDLIAAYALSFEAGVRVGKAAPAHHDGGWHLTGTLGSISAGIAVGRLLGLDATQMVHALGIATTQAAGMQQNRGTMCKSFHAGKAASNGLLAAFIAREGFDSSDEIIEGRRGFIRIFSSIASPEGMLDGLGSDWHLLRNGHKPYACGIVLHPMIDGMVALHRLKIPAENVAAIEVKVHPLAVKITGVQEPQTGLQSKFSIYHSAAVAFLDGNAGIAQYSDARAAASDVAALRRRVLVATDDGLRGDEARAAIVETSGQRHEVHIEHASGTRHNPMSDAGIENKFRCNAAVVLDEATVDALTARLWALDTLEDARGILALASSAR